MSTYSTTTSTGVRSRRLQTDDIFVAEYALERNDAFECIHVQLLLKNKKTESM